METDDLGKLIREFLESLEVERNLSPYTIRNYNLYLHRFGDWMLGQDKNFKMKKLSVEAVRKYRLFLSRFHDQKGKQLSVATQSYYVIALRSFLKWLTKQGYKSLPAERIDLPKAESKSLTFLNRDQVERLLSQPQIGNEMGLRDKAILEVLFSTGLRVSELTHLNREQINFSTREFGVVGKGRRVRVVFLSERASLWLKRYLVTRQDRWRPLFIRYTGKKSEITTKEGEEMRFTSRGVQRVVEKYRRKAGIGIKITPHGLRHSFATDLLQAGAGLREVQEMLGHKNVSTTQIYTHVTNPQLRAVHEKYHLGNRK